MRPRLAELRQDPLLGLLTVLLAVTTVAPLFVGRYVPLLDYPNHTSISFVLFHLGDPAWGFGAYYKTNFAPVPYGAQYLIVQLLAYPFGVELAEKLLLGAALLALPASVALYLRRLGRDPRLALLAFPLSWNVNTAHGFLSFVAGLPVLFAALAALDAWAESPTVRRGLGAAVLGATLYFFHVLPFALFLIIGGATALLAVGRLTPGRLLLAPLPTLPAALIGYACYRWADTAKVNLPLATARGLGAFEGVYNDVATNLANVAGWLLDILPCSLDEIAALGLGLLWLLLVTSRAGSTATAVEPVAALGLRGLRGELALALALAAYLLLPRSLLQPFYWFAVNRRLVVVVALFALPLVRGRLVGPRRALLVAAAGLAMVYTVDIAVHFYRFNQRARGFDEVMAGVPRGQQVLPLMLNLRDPDIQINAFNQWGSWVQLRQGGYVLYNFPVEFPIAARRRLPAPPWDHPEMFYFPAHEHGWDYFLVHGPSSLDPFVGFHHRVRLHRRAGDWALWKKLPPAEGAR